MKKERFVGFMAAFMLMIVLVLMAVTNPTKDEYDSWAKEQISSKTGSGLAQSIIALMAAL